MNPSYFSPAVDMSIVMTLNPVCATKAPKAALNIN